MNPTGTAEGVFQVEREPAVDLEARRSVWRMFAAWADEAEQVFTRAGSVGRAGAPVAGVAELEDALGRVRARLTVRPEQVARQGAGTAGAVCPREGAAG